MRHSVALGRLFVLLFVASIVWPSGLVAPATVAAAGSAPAQGSDPTPRVLGVADSFDAAPITVPPGGARATANDPSIGAPPRFPAADKVATRTELAAARTEKTRTYANPDGTYTTQLSQGRLNFQDPTGAWQPMDLHLVANPGGAYDVRVTANDRAVAFGTASADAALGQIGAETGTVAVRALDFPSSLTEKPVELQASPSPSVEPSASPTTGPAPSPSDGPVLPSANPSTSPGPTPAPSAPPASLPAPSTVASADPNASPAGSALPAGSSAPSGSFAPSPSALPSPSPEVSPSPTVAPTASPTAAPSPSASPDASPTPSASPSPSASPRPGILGDESLVFSRTDGSERVFVQPTDLGFEFGALLSGPTDRSSYSFALSTGPLISSVDVDGATILLSQTATDRAEATTIVGGLSAPFLLDANEAPAPAGSVSVGLYRPGIDLVPPVGVSAESLAGLGPDEVVLTYSIDPLWLAQPDRAFPVVLDPSACIGQGASGCTINDTSGNFDHFIGSGIASTYPTGWTTVRTGYDSRSDDGDTYGTMRSLLYFSPVTLPDAAVFYDADLKVHISSEYGGPDTHEIWAYRITKSWGQTTTWNGFSSGGAYSTIGGTSLTLPASGTVNFDVDAIAASFYTRRAKDWKAGYGFLLRMNTESSTIGEVEFDRYNDATTSFRPVLELDYTIPSVAIDFASGLGANYAPSAMVVNKTTKVPIVVTNKTGSAHVLDKCTADGDCWMVGYRWFDEKGSLIGGGTPTATANLPADIAVGASSTTFSLPVTAPSVVGQDTLTLDLVHYSSAGNAYYSWSSDWATPSLLYSRNKKVLTADNTRWVGSSKIERDEFRVNVVAGGGNIGETQWVSIGDGGSLGINLASGDIAAREDTGLGFADRIGLGLTYGYHSADATNCTSYVGILGACGWSTNWDERISGGAGQTGYDYTYQDPAGTRSLMDTSADGQIVGGASALIDRTRATILDENSSADGPDAGTAPDVPAVLASGEGFSAFSGTLVGKVAANVDVGFNLPDKFSLNAYHRARFAFRTSAAVSSGMCFQVHNVSNSDFADRWYCYTVGTAWNTGFDETDLGLQSGGPGGLTSGWNYYDVDLYSDMKATGHFGSAYDDYQLTNVQIESAGGTGSTYLDGFRLESSESIVLDDALPSWTSNGSLATLVTPSAGDPAPLGSKVIQVAAAPLASSPICQVTGSCWSAAAGGLWSYAFGHWSWRKSGGQTAAIQFFFHDQRSGAPCNATDCSLTYYAGPAAPAGAVTAIQVSPTAPTEWTLVRRNLLEDARTVFRLYDDAGSAGADDVSLKGYALSAVDGTYLQVDGLGYGSLADIGAVDPTGLTGAASHPSSAGDTTFVYDFSADYADGSRHYFNRDGLLRRIRDRDGQTIDLDWSYDVAKWGPTAYTLTAIHAPTDATVSGGTTYERQFSLSRGSDGSLTTIRFDEDLGSTASDHSARAAIFEIVTTSGEGDLAKVSPARHVVGSGATGTFCGTRPNGCAEFSYTSHVLTTVADPRWDGTTGGANEYRWQVSGSLASAPMAIKDLSHGSGGTALLNVLTFADTRDASLLYTRPLWQDAAAGAANSASAADLTPDGRVLVRYAPRACTTDCSTSGNWPATASQANYRSEINEFDGLARVTTTKTVRCPAAAYGGCTGSTELLSVSRQGSNAGAKVDNYNDPLAADDVPWTQSADQYFASVRDSGGANPDLYRTESVYDGHHQLAEQREPHQLATSIYSSMVSGATPYAYWRLAESSGTTMTDAIGAGAHSGNYSGSPTLAQPGAIVRDANTSISLNGTSQYGSVSGMSVSGSYSLEAWVEPGSTSANLAWAGSRSGADKSFDIKFCVDLANCKSSQVIRIDVGNGTAWLLNANVPFAWTAGHWYQVTAVVDGTARTAAIYVDGQAIANFALTGTGAPLLADGTRNLKLGNNGLTTPSEYFKGGLDDVALYTSALSPADVAAHFAAARAVTYVDTVARHDSRGRSIEGLAAFSTNGGFEDGWNGWSHPAGSSLSTSAHGGGQSASFGANVPISQILRLVPGQTVRVQYFAQGTPAITAAIDYWNTSGTPAWTALASAPFTDATWGSGHAWDVTLPTSATDGQIRLTFSHSSAGATGYVDDVVVMTGWARTDYDTASSTAPGFGLPTDTTTLRPCPPAGCTSSTVRAHLGYTAGTSAPNLYPPIFPTSAYANYGDGTPGPNPDDDVRTQSLFDAWGRTLATTDPDGRTSSSHYGTNQSELDTSTDGLGKVTAYTYDGVGNRLTVTSPKAETTTTTYDALNHALTVTAPAPVSTVTKTIYNAYGQATATIANRVDDAPSGASGLDDLVTYAAYDALGNTTTTIADTSVDGTSGFTGAIKAKTATTYDLAGSVVATTVYTDSAWTAGTARTTTNHFETYAPPSGTPLYPATFSRLGASGVELATGAPSSGPLCPDSASAHCNSASSLDLGGQTIATTDAYGNLSTASLDLAGRTVITTVDYVAGGSHGTDNDQNLVGTSTLDIAGRPTLTTDPSGRTVATTYDALGRATLVTRKDSAGVAQTDTKTVYLASGRLDRTSADIAGLADTARTWTKTVYDGAGRAYLTLAHYDTAGLPQIATDNFEDGVTSSGQTWTNGSAGVFTATGGSSGPELGVASPQSGEGRLRVTTGTGANSGSEWVLPGTFKSGHTYKARVYVNAPSGTTVNLKLGTAADSNTSAVSVAGNGAWQGSAVVSWTPGADRTGVAVGAIRTGAASAATFYLDDVIVWDAATPDMNIPTESVYDDDGQIIRSIVVPGDPTSEASLVTRTDYDVLGRVSAVIVNDIAGSGGASQTSFGPAADAHVKSANTTTNYGTATTLQVRADAATPNDYKPFLKFTVSGLSGTVTNVKLRLTNTATSNSSSRDVCVYAVADTTWTETGITWATAPTVGSSLACVHGNQAAGAIDYDLGVPFTTNGTYAYAVFQTTSTSVIYSSKEGANPPALIVSTGSAPSDSTTSLTTSTTYDALGRSDTTTNPKGIVTKTAFDRLGRPSSVLLDYVDGTPTDGTTVDDDVKSTFAFDTAGDQIAYCPAVQVLTTTCDPSDGAESQAWHYVFDKLGRQTKQIPPDNASAVDLNTSETVYEQAGFIDKTCSYPAGGSCASTTNTHWTDLTNDQLGRVKSSKLYTRPSGTDILGFTFTTTYNLDGSPASVTDGTDTLTYVIDAAGRLQQLKRGATVLTDFSYAGDGTVLKRTDASQTAPGSNIVYDWAKRPTTVPLSSTVASGSIGYTYRLDGLLKTKSLPAGTETATLAYDPAKRPSSVSFTIAGSSAISQTYDRAGNVTTEARNLANATAITGDSKSGTITYSYDELNRLLGSSGAGGTRAYRYDLDGNRVYKSDPARTLTYTFDRTDEQINETNGTSTAFVYDTYGNLTKKAEDDLSQTTLAYDVANRLTGLTPATGSAATFTFDALARNKTRLVGGVTTDTYGYIGPSESVYEVVTTGTGARTIEAALGPDGSRLALKNTTSGTQTWSLFDLHGDLAALENSAMSAVTDALRYDGYGVTVDSDGSFGSPWKFQGALDVGPGAEPLYDIGARMYAPSLGSWTSLDSVMGSAQDPLSLNRFLYAEANPATLIDPTGHWATNGDGDVCVACSGKPTPVSVLAHHNPALARDELHAPEWISRARFRKMSMYDQVAYATAHGGQAVSALITRTAYFTDLPVLLDVSERYTSKLNLDQVDHYHEQRSSGADVPEPQLYQAPSLAAGYTSDDIAVYASAAEGYVPDPESGDLGQTFRSAFGVFVGAGPEHVAPVARWGGGSETASHGGVISEPGRTGRDPAEPAVKPGSTEGSGVGSRYITPGVKAVARQESGDRCVFCATDLTKDPGPNQLNFDHSIPYAQGGDSTIMNIQTACRACNQAKGNQTSIEYLIRQYLEGNSWGSDGRW